MSNPNSKPSILLRICCVITRSDPDIAVQCNKLDQNKITTDAAMLLLQFIITSGCFSYDISSHFPKGVAILVGIVIGLTVFLLDQAILASDWELRGVLRQRQPIGWATLTQFGGRLGQFVGRFLIAGSIALANSYFTTIEWLKDTVDNHIEEKRSPQKVAAKEEYARLLAELQRPLSQVERELNARIEERAQLERRIDRTRSTRNQVAEQVSIAGIEMVSEEKGLDRPKGQGAKYHVAQRKEQEATRHLARLDEDLEVDKLRLEELESRIAALQKNYDGRNREFQDQLRALDERRQHDLRLIPVHSDFLGRSQGLVEIIKGPNGGYALFIALLITTVLLGLELAFFVRKQTATPPSLYPYRLIGRALLEARQVDTKLARNMRDLGGPNDEGPAPIQAGTPSGFQDPPGGGEAPLFDPSCVQQASHNSPTPDRAGADASEVQRYEVIGGAFGERVSRAEAEANRGRYWVNPDRPEEIWDARHRQAVLGPETDQ